MFPNCLWKDTSVFVDRRREGCPRNSWEQKDEAFDVDFWWSNGTQEGNVHAWLTQTQGLALMSRNWLSSYQKITWFGVRCPIYFSVEIRAVICPCSKSLVASPFCLVSARTFVYMNVLGLIFNWIHGNIPRAYTFTSKLVMWYWQVSLLVGRQWWVDGRYSLLIKESNSCVAACKERSLYFDKTFFPHTCSCFQCTLCCESSWLVRVTRGGGGGGGGRCVYSFARIPSPLSDLLYCLLFGCMHVQSLFSDNRWHISHKVHTIVTWTWTPCAVCCGLALAVKVWQLNKQLHYYTLNTMAHVVLDFFVSLRRCCHVGQEPSLLITLIYLISPVFCLLCDHNSMAVPCFGCIVLCFVQWA